MKVAEAIQRDDQKAATEEKSKLEEAQRLRAKSGVHHKPRYFKHDPLTKNYDYIHAEFVLNHLLSNVIGKNMKFFAVIDHFVTIHSPFRSFSSLENSLSS